MFIILLLLLPSITLHITPHIFVGKGSLHGFGLREFTFDRHPGYLCTQLPAHTYHTCVGSRTGKWKVNHDSRRWCMTKLNVLLEITGVHYKHSQIYRAYNTVNVIKSRTINENIYKHLK